MLRKKFDGAGEKEAVRREGKGGGQAARSWVPSRTGTAEGNQYQGRLRGAGEGEKVKRVERVEYGTTLGPVLPSMRPHSNTRKEGVR